MATYNTLAEYMAEKIRRLNIKDSFGSQQAMNNYFAVNPNDNPDLMTPYNEPNSTKTFAANADANAAVLERQRVADIETSWSSPESRDKWFANNPNDPYTIRELAAGRINPPVTKPSIDTVTKVTGDTLATLGNGGTVVDANKINTQGTGTAGTGTAGTGTAGTETAGTGTAGTGTAGTGTAGTGTAGTVAPSGLTLADLKGLGYLTKSDFDTANSTLKSDILTGVDAKNKAFGTQATQGFMDAFKNFQIPTNQQTGVNLGNYNDNRNAAADQWWSQYVTGRR